MKLISVELAGGDVLKSSVIVAGCSRESVVEVDRQKGNERNLVNSNLVGSEVFAETISIMDGIL